MKRPCSFLIAIFVLVGGLFAQPAHPDSSRAFLTWLRTEQSKLDQIRIPKKEDLANAQKLGRWDLSERWLNNPGLSLMNADEYALQQAYTFHRYDQLRNILNGILIQGIQIDTDLTDRWQAQLSLISWELQDARMTYLSMMKDSHTKAEALLGLGKIEIYQKNYLKAEALGEELSQITSHKGKGFLLMAEANFWLRRQEKAETYLIESLKADPFNADARFAYGYAIWRRRDATQLQAMADQWEIALTLNPLHYQTHWHWGNGHTHLTFADYADPEEQIIRPILNQAMDSIVQGQVTKGLEALRATRTQYPTSVIPDLYRASIFYQLPEKDFPAHLDSSQAIFLQMLAKKPHFGPAHNGLAAVIKKRQMQALAEYPELEKNIEAVRIPQKELLYKVFPDLGHYPGDRVAKMVWSQLGPTTAYLPMLARLGRTFALPPLHVDLAIAMKNSFFRGGTTFDNRQWMDIRGVGSGATGIEYIERGSHLERNVTQHEYVHLFHGRLFTDQEMRDVRNLYYQAMKDSAVLDYYAANNEFEYLAQAIPAYYSEKKVHPLNHKSANTRTDLKEKDPAMYKWIEQLEAKQKAYIKGDSTALKGNWAEAYLQLARQIRPKRLDSIGLSYIDSALYFVGDYIPAWVEKIEFYQRKNELKTARKLLSQARQLAPGHPYLYVKEGEIWEEQFLNNDLSRDKAIRRIAKAYESAYELEQDFMLRANQNTKLLNFYESFSLWDEGVQLAEDYVLDGPEISTYLQDEKERNQLFLAKIQGKMGNLVASKRIFDALITANPQNYAYRRAYAEVLYQIGSHEELKNLIEPSYELLKAAGSPQKWMLQYLLIAALAEGDSVQAISYQQIMNNTRMRGGTNPMIEVDIISRQYGADSARVKLSTIPKPNLPMNMGTYLYWQGKLLTMSEEWNEAQSVLEKALEAHPYHLPARILLMKVHLNLNDAKASATVGREGSYLPLPPGPFYSRQMEKMLEE
ncbi:MAG: hypothetical protein AAFY71_12450 [Bacteroidota bacterium]